MGTFDSVIGKYDSWTKKYILRSESWLLSGKGGQTPNVTANYIYYNNNITNITGGKDD